MPITDDAGIRALSDLDRIAVVGCSSTPGKAAHDVPRYLSEHGYDIYPVNPFAEEILGREAVDTLADVQDDVELVEVFRPSDEVPTIVDQTLARQASHGDVEAIWLQLGITHDEALRRAEDGGLRTTQDRCLKIEHRRLVK